jgi:hypothetical protein
MINPKRIWLSTLLIIVTLSTTLIFGGCNPSNQTTEKIPTGPVNLNIDLNLSSYMNLANPGAYMYFDGGVKGVLVIHDYDDNWYAFERGCAFQPLDACAKVWVDSISIQIQCGTPTGTGFQPCCNSKYSFNGFPLEGPTKGRLARYQIQRSANIISVYN